MRRLLVTMGSCVLLAGVCAGLYPTFAETRGSFEPRRQRRGNTLAPLILAGVTSSPGPPTVTVTVAGGDVVFPSLAVYVNVSVPAKFAFGV